MSRTKVLGLLDDLGGHASTKALRVVAKEKYPGLSLHRTIHTTLKKLEEDGVLSFLRVNKEWVRTEHNSMVAKYEHIHNESENDMHNFENNIDKITLKPVDIPHGMTEEEKDDLMNVRTRPKGKAIDSFKYRDKHEIAWSVVKAISDGRTRTTAIMYSSWLSHYQLVKYLNALLKNDLITVTGKNQYGVTAKGIEFMEAMKKVSEIKFD